MNKGKMAAIIAMGMAMAENPQVNHPTTPVKKKKKPRPPKRYGTKFIIDGVEVWALNQKNAERKAANIKKSCK